MEENLEPGERGDSGRAAALMEQGRQAERDGHEQHAFHCYAESLALCRGLGNRAEIVRLLIRISYLSGWADFGDGLDMFSRRARLAEEALPLARESGDAALLAEALCAFSAGVFGEKSIAMLEESIQLARACGARATQAAAMHRLALTLALQRNHKRGRALNHQALRLYQKLGDKAGEASLLFTLAIRARKPYKRRYLERALELRRGLGHKRRMAEILMMLDWTCEPHELDWSEANNREALELCREIGSATWEAGRLTRLAEIARARGSEAEAVALEAESLRVYTPPPIDPEVEEAFKEALSSGDMEQTVGAIKKMKF